MKKGGQTTYGDARAKKIISSLLLAEIFITVGLDTVNEVVGVFGVPQVLGLIARPFFICINIIAIVSFGKKREFRFCLFVCLWLIAMVLREAHLGVDGIKYAASYWSKPLLYITTFFAIKSSVCARHVKLNQVESYLRYSIYLIAPMFIILALTGVLNRREFDSGYAGLILSKNSTSVTFLILLVLSIYFVSRKKIKPYWTIALIVSLFFLGSKAAIVFASLIVAAGLTHEFKGRISWNLKKVFPMAILMMALLLLFHDVVWSAVESQFLQYQYVLNEAGGSFVDYLLTGRNDLLDAATKVYLEKLSPLSIMFGCGISTLSEGIAEIVSYSGNFRSVEMDVFEIFYASGIVGILVILFPIAVTFKGLKRREDCGYFYFNLGMLIVMCFMVLGGHVVTEGMPAAYFGSYLAFGYLISSESEQRRVDGEILMAAESNMRKNEDGKRVAIVTLQGGFNYGNRLQNYATSRVYEKLGYQAITLLREKRPSLVRRTVDAARRLKSALKHEKQAPMSPGRVDAFRRFDRLMKFMEIREANERLNGYFSYYSVGSDQVWNLGKLSDNDNWYYLAFAEPEQRIALSPSIGVSKLSKRQMERLREGVSGFSRLSVRERRGAELIKECSGLDAEVICDPTLVLSADEWREVADGRCTPASPYVFTYLLGGVGFEAAEVIEKVSKYGRLPIVALSDRQNDGEPDAGPAEFIDLIDHAAHVVTDSFHAAVFSSILQTPLTIVHREGGMGMFSRLEQLSEMLGIEEKVYGTAVFDIARSGDYEGVPEAIEREGNRFIEYLKGCLDG